MSIVAAIPPRHRIEAAIEALISLLDATEPDHDLEPSLGWNPYGEPDLEGDDADLEPWLGWTTTMAHGSVTDAELDDCDDEPGDNGIADSGGQEEQGLKWAALDTIHAQMGQRQPILGRVIPVGECGTIGRAAA